MTMQRLSKEELAAQREAIIKQLMEERGMTREQAEEEVDSVF